MILDRQNTGQRGENLAFSYLKNLGFEILHTNYRCQFGKNRYCRTSYDKIHFVEVKTRNTLQKRYPHEAVNYFKRRHLGKAVQYYILQNKIKNFKLSIDVILILLDKEKIKDLKHFKAIDVSH